MLPLMIDLAGRLVVVVGSGRVGVRKARTLLDAGASIRLIDPNASRSLGDSDRIAVIQEEFAPHHLQDAFLVVNCATPEVATRIQAAAQVQGLLYCDATGSETPGDVVFPSHFSCGPLQVAVSTSAVAPAAARTIRARIEAEYARPEVEAWLQLQHELRELAQRQVTDIGARSAQANDLARWVWVERIREIGIEAVRREMLARYPLNPPG